MLPWGMARLLCIVALMAVASCEKAPPEPASPASGETAAAQATGRASPTANATIKLRVLGMT